MLAPVVPIRMMGGD